MDGVVGIEIEKKRNQPNKPKKKNNNNKRDRCGTFVNEGRRGGRWPEKQCVCPVRSDATSTAKMSSEWLAHWNADEGNYKYGTWDEWFFNNNNIIDNNRSQNKWNSKRERNQNKKKRKNPCFSWWWHFIRPHRSLALSDFSSSIWEPREMLNASFGVDSASWGHDGGGRGRRGREEGGEKWWTVFFPIFH